MSAGQEQAIRRFIEAAGDHLHQHHGRDEGVEEVLTRLGAQLLPFDESTRVVPRELPACRHLRTALDQSAEHYPVLTETITAILPSLHWQKSPPGGTEPTLPGYMTDFAYTVVLGGGGPVPADDFAVGLFVIGPDQHYPEHSHDAPELYWLLSGPADFHFGDKNWVSHAPGTTIWNASQRSHATHTREAPMLVIWCWTERVNGAYYLLGKELNVL